MKARLLAAFFSMVAVTTAYCIGFYRGQIYDSKQRLDFDLLFAMVQYHKMEANDLTGARNATEVQIQGKARALAECLYTPFQYYRYRRTLHVHTDAELKLRLEPVILKANSFTNFVEKIPLTKR